MRWDNLFDDLEGQLDHELHAEEIDLRAEEERLRLGRLSLRDRVLAIRDAESRHTAFSIRMRLTDGSSIAVRPVTIGRDWFSADVVTGSARQSQAVVPFAAVAALVLSRAQIAQSLRPAAIPESDHALSARLTLSFVLRDLCRRRRFVELRLADGTIRGTLDRVGRDHLDIAVHETGSARRESAVSEYRVVAFAQVLVVLV